MAKHSFAKSLKIQIRVIGALLMREVLTRYGRHNLGFLWLFLEPAVFTLGIVLLWSITKLHGGSVSIAAFAITGYSYVLMWRNVASRCAQAVSPNLSLMYHRNVRVIDIFFARIILEISGITISFIMLSSIFIITGLMPMPADIFLMLQAWGLLILFAIGLGMVIGVVSEFSEVFDRIWHTINYLFFPLSGALFFVDSLPTSVQKIALYIPPLHAIEMLRHGYFGSIVRTHEDPFYLFVSSIILILFGLYGISILGRKVIPE
ncbi:ABC transporter permease [Acinetobacter brisouii]|uniref:ABC transporter permease n=1 Tax=Acinetobacter brisouii TaxID=396323 RepID=UPI00124FFFCD|nr:ABC transporter permease [Acinetobacter brisouii]